MSRTWTIRGAAPAAALLLAGGAACAAELVIPKASYPALPPAAASLEGFVPKGWRVEATAHGDLDGDGRDDLAFVLRQADPRNVLDNRDNFGPERFDTNPHLLAVALAQPGGGYRLALENHTLIARPTEPNMEDVLEEGGIAIRRGSLQASLHVFANAGGWGMSTIDYTFRYSGGAFRLTGYDSVQVQRNTGEMQEVSINYQTRRAKLTSGRIDGEGSKARWKAMPAKPAPMIDQIGDGVEFDPGVPGEPR